MQRHRDSITVRLARRRARERRALLLIHLGEIAPLVGIATLAIGVALGLAALG